MSPSQTSRTRKPAPSAPKRSPLRRAARGLPFLLEIGTEELPASFLPQALQDFSRIGQQVLTDNRLGFDGIRTVGTPRRLALLVENLQTQQTPLTQEILGPPVSAAYDASGQPTKAAQGFARSQDVPVEQLRVKETPKGAYLAVEKHQRGQPAKQVLMEVLPKSLSQITFPKSMRWNHSRMKFGRPVRWIVALLGNQALDVEFAGLRSGLYTRRHRFFKGKGKLKGQQVRLTSAITYGETLKRVGVLVDPDERRKLIIRQITGLAGKAKGQIDARFQEELIEEAVWGVEYPHAILGSFSKDFLEVPKPVLISSMKEHQGFFSIESNEGLLLPKFIAVTNMPWGNDRLMIKGNERVLAARLSDAKHFFREDTKRPLHDRVEALQGIMFHHKLGSVRQKVDRLCALVDWMAEQIGRNDLRHACGRAAYLAKADLLTGMVGEFPDLQGVMGEEYAQHDGESAEVCRAIGEQYLPKFPDDDIPATAAGALLAVADRCDSIVSFFAAGMAPTGSEDPLGLRRAAYGLVRIVTETPLRLDLVGTVKQTLALLAGQGMAGGTSQTLPDILEFIVDRLRFYGKQTRNLREDIMEAVTRLPRPATCDLTDLLNRMQALQDMIHLPDFDPLMVGFKRAHRIVQKEQWTAVHVMAERFSHGCEHRLAEALALAKQRVQESVKSGDYGKGLQALLELKTPIDEFFSSVMVNDPDETTRANRLSLLKEVDDLFLQLADLSCIQSKND